MAQMSAKSNLHFVMQTIWLSQDYRRYRDFHLRRLILFSVLALVVSLYGNYSLVTRGDIYRYVPVEYDGTIKQSVDLSLPNHSDDYVVAWTMEHVTRAYSFDFVRYRRQLQESKRAMTQMGWLNFEDALRRSGNFEAVLQHKYVVTAVPTGPGKLLKKGDFWGRHAWRVQFPMLVTYRTIRDKKPVTTSQDLLVTVVVIRQPEHLQEDGLGIRSIIAE